MRLKSVFLFTIIFALSANLLQAQSLSLGNVQNVKVSQLSDQQILQVWKKFQSAGVSEAEALKMLGKRGVPPSEILLFKQRLDLLNVGNNKSAAKAAPARNDTIISARDTSKKIERPAPRVQTSIFGYDIFNNPNLKFEPNLRITTPKNYVLGPDDEVIILLTGLNEASVNSKISPEGYLKVPYAGLIYVAGYTIEQAQTVIRQKMQKVYPALNSGQTKLTVNLGSVKSIRVTIIGEVKQPGAYTISSLSGMFNALYLAGGPGQKGSLRYIELIRNNRVLKTVDFYSFLNKGSLSGNVRLEDQDVIRIPVYKKRVAIAGEVKKPAIFELRETETLEDLIEYAGGFSDNAYTEMAKVVQKGKKELNVRDVNASLFDRFILKNADSVYFEAILNRYANRVVIEGAVYRPGVFELTPTLTVRQLISKAEGIREDAFVQKGYVKRTRADREKEMISFDIRKVITEKDFDVALQREDTVMILAQNELRDELTISIDGFVRNPGTFVYRQGMKVSDLIGLAGGFTHDAANHRVEISRLVKNFSDSVANQLVNVIAVNIDSSLKNTTSDVTLQPLDYVHIPRLVNYHTLGNITIQGEVLFPGYYALQRRDENAFELIKRAGGITPEGSLANAQVFRNGTRVDIALSKRKNKFNAQTLLLKPGDSIVIPRFDPFIQVAGAVNNPQLLRYSTSNFKYYINSAGGVTENARLQGAYVQYPNGISKPIKRFLIFKNYPAVVPGSKITIPEKAADLRFKLGLGEVGALTSALTALIGLIAIMTR